MTQNISSKYQVYDINKNLTLIVNMRRFMKKRTFWIYYCFVIMFVMVIVVSTAIALRLQELQTQFKRFSTTMEHEMSLSRNNYGLITLNRPFTRSLQRIKRDNEEQQDGKKGETWRQSEEESGKQQQSKEEGEKQRRNKEKEGTWRQNEEKSEERQSERKNNIRRQYEKKGEKRRQNRRGHKHNRRRSRPLVATFIGQVPDQFTNTAYIGPWIKSKTDYHKYDLTKFHLVEGNMSVEVDISGLYMIFVQIYYFGHSMNYTYWLLLNSKGSSTKQKIITCTTSGTEVSCHTSVVIYLRKGDRLSLQQQEKKRSINLREGYSQIQITLLANDRKHST